MANKIASLRLTLSAPGPGSSTYSVSKSVLAKFAGSAVNSVDVPESSTTPVTVSFGSVAVAATLVIVENNTDGDLAIQMNGSEDTSYKMPPGGVAVFGGDDAPTAGPLLSMICTPGTTEAGTIDTWVFGDPEAEE